jgi:hypothetical protein
MVESASIQGQDGLPVYLKPFFWDVDFQRLTISDSAFFIISRLMEHTDENGFRFLLNTYRREEMIAVLEKSRTISRRSRNFWRVLFGLDKLCTPRRYPTPFGDCSRD